MDINRLTVADRMSKPVYCAAPDMSVRELISELVQRRIQGCPVCDPDGKLVGEISLSDAAVGLAYPPEGVSHPTVRDLMVADVIGLERTAPLLTAVGLFRKHRIHRLVITYRGQVVGILTPFDLLPEKDRPSVLI